MDNIPNLAMFLCGFRKLKLTRVHLHLPYLSQLQSRCRNNESWFHLIAKIQQRLSCPTVYSFFPCKWIENQSLRCTITSFNGLSFSVSLSPCPHRVCQESWISWEAHVQSCVSPQSKWEQSGQVCVVRWQTLALLYFWGVWQAVMSVLWLSLFSSPLFPCKQALGLLLPAPGCFFFPPLPSLSVEGTLMLTLT